MSAVVCTAGRQENWQLSSVLWLVFSGLRHRMGRVKSFEDHVEDSAIRISLPFWVTKRVTVAGHELVKSKAWFLVPPLLQDFKYVVSCFTSVFEDQEIPERYQCH